MKFKLEQTIFFLVIFRPMISFFDGKISIIGTISLAILDLLLIIYLFKNKYKIITWVIISATLVLFTLGTINSIDVGIAVRDGSKFITFIILLNLCVVEKFKNSLYKFIFNYQTYIKFQILVIYIILFLHTLDSSKYNSMYDERMFTSVFPHSHSLAYCVLLMITLIDIIYKNNKSKFMYRFLMLESMYILMLTSARLATIVGLIMIFTLNKDYILAVVTTLFGGVYIKLKGIENISFVKKFIESANYGSVTSGRNILWDIDLSYFNRSSLINKILGNGTDFSYKLHLEKYGSAIWSHNDFFNVLLAYGLMGLLIYFYTVINYILTGINRNNLIERISMSIVLFSLAFGNGAYIYTDFIMLLVILPIAYDKNNKNKVNYYEKNCDIRYN